LVVQEAFWVVHEEVVAGQCEPSDVVSVAVTMTLVALVLDKYVVVGSSRGSHWLLATTSWTTRNASRITVVHHPTTSCCDFPSPKPGG